jgi:hypothetical protein
VMSRPFTDLRVRPREASTSTVGDKRVIVAERKQLCVAAMNNQRRFPPPWSVEDIGACFITAT